MPARRREEWSKKGAIAIDVSDITPGQLADLIFEAADKGKAQDLLILDVVGLTPLCDYFVICHGLSLTHVENLAREVTDTLDEEHGITPKNRQSVKDAKWILLDYGSVVLHILSSEARHYYGLETLWGDAVVARRQPGPPEPAGIDALVEDT